MKHLFFAGLVIAAIQTMGYTQTPIHNAAREGDAANVTALLAVEPSLVNAKDQGGATPLMYAIHFGKTEVVTLLLEKGADVNARASTGTTALYEASGEGQAELVKLLLEKGASVNAKNVGGCTPLLLASENGQLEVVRLLLKKGADVNAQASYNVVENSATPLIGATKLRIDYDSLGAGPLQGKRAVCSDKKHGYFDVVKVLLDNGAKVDVTDNWDITALTYASKNGQVDVVKLLLDRGAGVDAQGHSGNGTPLYFAARAGEVEVVKLLLSRGANPNVEVRGTTPLQLAAKYGFTNVVELLSNAVKRP